MENCVKQARVVNNRRFAKRYKCRRNRYKSITRKNVFSRIGKLDETFDESRAFVAFCQLFSSPILGYLKTETGLRIHTHIVINDSLKFRPTFGQSRFSVRVVAIAVHAMSLAYQIVDFGAKPRCFDDAG